MTSLITSASSTSDGSKREYIFWIGFSASIKSAASSHSELDHQTCRGSSIGRACGSYLLRYSKPQGREFEPRLRLFLY
ncbi:hypothetical protein AUEXF2481DRAFT_36725 [Aureobasidium subglaciale EXF-2481]|uniref:Uncharacterized protein n=1 Tax=Aureobasidium subglaciale (strain EXF-2481) TaxID=1043005 RepID=A0A074ZI29_AURSE|nr:uncharacterized protein AUEXF2481DRAFT_36725 [Aureobasidium subglaciale EXF-2481]KEQ98211.1 hypothetical protein AUEXF2481DRAFT_36725 [Aureobasidium subglaciale EXF-2481]